MTREGTDMKRLFATAAMFCAIPLSATDTTHELLTAPWVRDRLVFQVTQSGKLQARRDADKTYTDVADGAPFVLSEQRDLTFHNFNPFKYVLKTDETTAADPNYTAIAQFLDALKKTEEGLAASKEPSATEAIRKILPNIRAPQPSLAAGGTDCSQYDALQKNLYDLHDKLKLTVLTGAEFGQWTDSAVGFEKVRAVRTNITGAVKKLQDNVQVLKDLDAAIAKTYIPDSSSGQPSCDKIKASTFALIYEITRTIDSKLQARTTLIAGLQTLNASLQQFADETNWREDAPADYIFYKPSPDFQTIKTLNIAVRPRSFTVTDDGKLSVEDGTPVARSIRVRAYSLIVPEVAAGFVHTDLAYPKYGTKQVGGQTIVAAAGTDKFPAQGAVLLNLVCRCWAPSIVYPALQLGLTNSKQYPGFLLGGGARFTGKYSLSVVGGIVITWFEDLKGLAVGDPVSGTADLQAHLQRRRAPAKTYVGVQYNF